MTSILNNPLIQTVAPLVRTAVDAVTPSEAPATTPETASEATGETSFESQLRALLSPDGSNQVSEEELFAGLLQEQIQKAKGDAAAEDYGRSLAQHKSALTRGDGYVNVEKAANMALDDMVSAGHLTQAEADDIYGMSFAAAQLDSNTSALYDGRGGPGDETVATADLESALASARLAIDALMNGDLAPASTDTESDNSSSSSSSSDDTASLSGETSSVTPQGNSLDGQGGFVFKPESEHEQKLVVLTPNDYKGKIAELLLKDENDNVVERGRSSGFANGDREHFRFDRAGGDYPNNLTVEIRMTNGDIKTYDIPNPGERYD